MVLSTREKTLLALLSGVVAIAVIYFGVTGIRGQQADSERRLASRMATLSEIERLNKVLATLESNPAPKRGAAPLVGRLESLARRANVAEGLQLNLLPGDRSNGVEAAEVRVDGMSLDELLDFLLAIETATPLLVIDHIELSPAFRDKTRLRATLRVLAQK